MLQITLCEFQMFYLSGKNSRFIFYLKITTKLDCNECILKSVRRNKINGNSNNDMPIRFCIYALLNLLNRLNYSFKREQFIFE